MANVIINNAEINTILTNEAYEETISYELWELECEFQQIKEGIYA